MTAAKALELWTVYARPADYPEQYVARLWRVVNGELGASDQVLLGDTLAAVRAQLPAGLYWLPRKPDDDPVIVEVWL